MLFIKHTPLLLSKEGYNLKKGIYNNPQKFLVNFWGLFRFDTLL